MPSVSAKAVQTLLDIVGEQNHLIQEVLSFFSLMGEKLDEAGVEIPEEAVMLRIQIALRKQKVLALYDAFSDAGGVKVFEDNGLKFGDGITVVDAEKPGAVKDGDDWGKHGDGQ